MELSPTLLFDHPSLRFVAGSVFEECRREVQLPESRSRVAARHVSGSRQPTLGRSGATTPKFGAVVEVVEAISITLAKVQGTLVGVETPLMAAGLDSLAAAELANVLSS